MSHIPDMQQLDSGFVAVGWLHPDHPFAVGDVAPEFLEKLKQYAARCGASTEALNSGAACGFHTCEFCERSHGVGNFGVPAGEQLFYSPEMIVHYVEAHRYAPPREFIDAVLSGPLPGTREFVEAVAPFLRRQEAARINDGVSITLERDVALVLLEFLSEISEREEFRQEMRADQVAVWTLVRSLETTLAERLDPKYDELLKLARRRVANHGHEEAV